MKRTSIIVLFALVTSFALIACHQNVTSNETSIETSNEPSKVTPFETSLKQDSCCYLMKTSNEMFPIMGLKNRYSVMWPSEGMLSKEAERELLILMFRDSTSSSFDAAASEWVRTNDYAELFPEELVESVKAEDIPADLPADYCYSYLDAKVEEMGNLLNYWVFSEAYLGGAHGVYYNRCRVYDRDSARIIHLADLVDTTNFGEVVVRAIEDLEVNSMVKEVLFEEEMFTNEFPVASDFYIDSTRSTITLVYQIYEIACYAAGSQEVVIPIYWLSKHRDLTPYAKNLFGKGSSL